MKKFLKQTFINKITKLKSKNKKIVLCHGVFDLVHLGHIEHFKSAKKFGDYLVVSLTIDKFIKKGPGRPVFNEYQRMEYLKQIKIIDDVILSSSESSIDVINLVKPDFYVKGPDYKNNFKDKTKKIILEKKAVEKNGGKIKFTNDITFSSSNLLNTSNYILNNHPAIYLYGSLYHASNFLGGIEPNQAQNWLAMYSSALERCENNDRQDSYGGAPVQQRTDVQTDLSFYRNR